jgi:asparagine synthase (glutamine-hydrolysing)
MCGILGIINNSLPEKEGLKIILDSLTHRGPDDEGIWIHREAENQVFLGQKRLSIIDLSTAGNQPMTEESGRFCITYNGELYNYVDIRAELKQKGVKFHSETDTEVVLKAWREWGSLCLKKFNGMFAFAIYDCQESTLHLVRDPVGIKPLYYHHSELAGFAFASEMKSLYLLPGLEKTISTEALRQFLEFQYIPAPLTILKNTYKLPPGHHLSLCKGKIEISDYVSKNELFVSQINTPKDKEPAVQIFDDIFTGAIKRQMVADVPVGCFLSGGIDSSLVTAFMVKNSPGRVKTFTIGFTENEFNEAKFAAETATHLQTAHTEYMVNGNEAMRIVPELYRYYDEPFADSSAIPMIILSSITRRQVTVSLSGDGGDELFCGYPRYKHLKYLYPLSRLPLMDKFGLCLQKSKNRHLQKTGVFLEWDKPQDQYRSVFCKWPRGFLDRLLNTSLNTEIDDNPAGEFFQPQRAMVENWMAADFNLYLPDDILVKVDRASMSASLEARVPVLDLEVINFARSLPHELKMRNGKGKWIMREVLKRYVPESLFERPKKGFGVPVRKWLQNELKDFLCTRLSATELKKHGLFNENLIQSMLDDFFSGGFDYSEQLWALLMFQDWYYHYMENNG